MAEMIELAIFIRPPVQSRVTPIIGLMAHPQRILCQSLYSIGQRSLPVFPSYLYLPLYNHLYRPENHLINGQPRIRLQYKSDGTSRFEMSLADFN